MQRVLTAAIIPIGYIAGVNGSRVFVGGGWSDTPIVIVMEMALLVGLGVAGFRASVGEDQQRIWWFGLMAVGACLLGISYQSHLTGHSWFSAVCRSLGASAFLGALIAFLADRWELSR